MGARSLVVAAAVLALGTACAVRTGPAPPPPPLPSAESLPRTLYAAGKPPAVLELPGGVVADVSYDLVHQTVSELWSWTPAGHPRGVARVVDAAVPYRPTAVARVAPDAVAVAGLGPGGATLLEVWEYGAPRTRLVADAATGEAVLVLTPGPVAHKRTVWWDAEGAEGPIAVVLLDRGTGDRVLVQLQSSRNVYSVDLVTGRARREVAGTVFAGVDGFTEFWAAEHPAKGLVYFLHSENARFFVLEDADADGKIDATRELQGNDFVTLGYSEADPL